MTVTHAPDAGDRFTASWVAGTTPPDLDAAVADLCGRDLEARRRAGEDRHAADYLARFPHLAARPDLTATLERVERSVGDLTTSLAPPDRTTAHGPFPPPPADAPDLPGLAVTRELGRGGMGVVYEAIQTELNRRVAVKMILRGDAGTPDRLRFHLEAEAVAALKHPNVVALYEMGSHAGRPYFVLEHVAGGALAVPLPPREAASVTAAVADAVAAAHAQGIIHRDLKPANVLLAEDGTPKLTDFGLARMGDSDLTNTGAVMGTPSYMAPEQARGETKTVGTPADVYGLGGILYACLTGKPPFTGKTVTEVIRKVCDDPPVPPRKWTPAVPRDLEIICLKCLEKEPAKRYASAAAVAADLRAWLAGESITARPPGAAELAVRWVRRKPYRAALIGLTVAVVVGGAVAAEVVRRQARRAEAVALVERLATAAPEAVPRVLADLSRFPEADRPLADRLATARDRLPLLLAHMPAHPEAAAEVVERLPAADLALVPTAVEAVIGRAVPLDPLRVAANGVDPGRAVVAFAALAALDPTADPSPAAAKLAAADPLRFAPLAGLFDRQAAPLTDALAGVYRRTADRDGAIPWLNRFGAARPTTVATLVTVAEPRHFAALFPLLVAHRDDAAAGFRAVLADPKVPPKEYAAAAVGLIRLGQGDEVWPRLAELAVPDRRAFLSHLPAVLGADPAPLAERYLVEEDPSARQALAFALGGYPADPLGGRVTARLASDFAGHPDAGVHAAAGWLLRRWKQPLPPAAGGRDWLTTKSGVTLSVVPAGRFLMGAPRGEGDLIEADGETPHTVVIPRSFAIGQTEVTVGQFLAVATHRLPSDLSNHAPTAAHPVVDVSWGDAARYCNALSKAEGIPEAQWCYVPVPAKDGQPEVYGPGMIVKPNHVRLTGYRLPTEAEWEFACRAGTTTPRYFGRSAELLDEFMVIAPGSDWVMQPVGTRKPNRLGLFDTLGNASEWVGDVVNYPETAPLAGAVAGGVADWTGVVARRAIMAVVTDAGLDGPLVDAPDKLFRGFRGADYSKPSKYARAAYRDGMPGGFDGNGTVGFRVARTVGEKK